MAWRASVLSLTLAVVVLVPAAAAQAPETTTFSVELEVTPYGLPVVPLTDFAEAAFLAKITCETGSAPRLEPLLVGLQASAPAAPWTTVSVAPATTAVSFAPDECLTGATKEITGKIIFVFRAEAPATAMVDLRLEAWIDGTETSDSTASASAVGDEATWQETVGILMRTQSRFDQAVIKAAPDSRARLPLVIQNEGNGAVHVQVTAAPDSSPELQFIPLDVITIAAQDQATVPVEVLTPDASVYRNDRQILVVLVEAVAADDADVTGEAQTLQATIQVQGMSVGESPGTMPAMLLLALGAFALATRRRVFQQ